MDYSRFIFKTEIDWIEFDIQLAITTHVTGLRNLFESSVFFDFIDGPGNCTGSRFKFRLQNPKSWDGVQFILNAIDAKYGFSTEPKIIGIEVALDAYSKTKNREELVEMAAHFYRFSENLPSENLRFAGKGGVVFSKFPIVINPEAMKGKQITDFYEMDFLAIQGLLAAGATLYVGSQQPFQRKHSLEITPADANSLRIYVKTTDCGGEVILSPKNQRARTERTLLGADLPFTTIAEARRYEFSKLAKLFKFRQLDSAKISAMDMGKPSSLIHIMREWRMKQLIERSPQIGQRVRRKFKKADGGGYREHAVLTKADRRLNKTVLDRLRSMTNTMRKAARRSEGGKLQVVEIYVEKSSSPAIASANLAMPEITVFTGAEYLAAPAAARLVATLPARSIDSHAGPVSVCSATPESGICNNLV